MLSSPAALSPTQDQDVADPSDAGQDASGAGGKVEGPRVHLVNRTRAQDFLAGLAWRKARFDLYNFQSHKSVRASVADDQRLTQEMSGNRQYPGRRLRTDLQIVTGALRVRSTLGTVLETGLAGLNPIAGEFWLERQSGKEASVTARRRGGWPEVAIDAQLGQYHANRE
jgi:hypothetical protein